MKQQDIVDIVIVHSNHGTELPEAHTRDPLTMSPSVFLQTVMLSLVTSQLSIENTACGRRDRKKWEFSAVT